MRTTWGWSGDPEWQYRKTLNMRQRVLFDNLSPEDRRLAVEGWLARRGESTRGS